MAAVGPESLALLGARSLFGAVIVFMGLNHFLDRTAMTAYADSKGLPAPGLAVVTSGAVLVLGGAGILLGAYPVVAAVAVAGFLAVAAVTMHDFWAAPDEDRQAEVTNFLKNVALAGGALALAALGTTTWTIGVGLRL